MAVDSKTGCRFLPWADAQVRALDDEGLLATIGDALIVAVGEPGHGAREPLELRNRIARLLAERGELGIVALETDILRACALDEYVQGGDGDAAEVAREGLGYGFGDLADNVALLRWLREHNGRSQNRVRLHGFDLPGGDPLGTNRHASEAPAAVARGLRRVAGPNASVLADEMDTLAVRFDPATARTACRDDAAQIAAQLDRVDAFLSTANAGRDKSATVAIDTARLAASNTRGVFDFLRAWPQLPDDLADLSTDTVARILEASGARDALMADNVAWLVDRLLPGQRLLMFAANGHVVADEHRGGLWVGHRGCGLPAGVHLRQRFSTDYRVLMTVSARPLFAAADADRQIDLAMAALGRPPALLALDGAPADAMLDEPRSFGTNGPFAQVVVPRRAVDAIVSLARLTPAPRSVPATPRRPVIDRKFGIDIVDPYRWLEADSASDANVRVWMDAQDRHAREAFARLPRRAAIRALVEEVWRVEKVHAPQRRGDRLFAEWNPGLDNHNRLQVQDGEQGLPRTLIDPNALDPQGGIVVQDWAPSADGRSLAYTVQRHGGDWRTLHVLDVDSGVERGDVVEGLKAAQFAWAPDGSGLFYTAFDRPHDDDPSSVTLESSVRFHVLGTAQADDRVVFLGERARLHLPQVSDDGLWLVVSSSDGSGSRHEVRVRRVSRPDDALHDLRLGFDHRWTFVGGDESSLLFFTDAGAPRGRVVALDPEAGVGQTPRTIVPERNEAIRGVQVAGDQIVVLYAEGVGHALRRHAADGRELPPVPLAEGVFIDQLRGHSSHRVLYLRSSSMVSPHAVHRFDLDHGRIEVLRSPRASWNPHDFVVRRLEAVSADGTRVPVTVAHARDLARTRPCPTALIAYGGFGLSLDPSFVDSRFAWILDGGAFAIAHVRGGAEFGAEWADAARKGGRLQVVEDYLACARALSEDGLTTPRALLATGASNGGLLVAGAVNMDPDAFGAVVCRVPVTDMLRYTDFTIGRLWTEELGDPDVEADFAALRAYSPLHNVREGRRYPPIVVTTAEADDRAVPAHAFKYVATLQNSDLGEGPFLLRVERGAGHGQGKPAGKLIDEFADLWAFARAHLDD